MAALLLNDGPDQLQGQGTACAVPSGYAVTELSGIGGPITESFALNDVGQAAGRGLDGSWRSRALGWTGGGVVNMSGSDEGGAYGISSDGRVAGWRRNSSGTRGAVWSGSSVKLLAPLANHVASGAYDVNRAGTAVGWSTSSTGDASAVMWRNGQASSLATGAQRPSSSYAFAINDANQIVGRGDFPVRPFRRALVWDGSGMRALPDLGAGYASASSISGNGIIAGGSLHPVTSKFHAVVWSAGAIHDLGLLDGVHPTAAYGVNDCGTVVGDALVNPGQEIYVAVVWQNGVARDLNQLVSAFDWNLVTARAINNRGEIVGSGYRSGFSGQRAFLLRPVQ
jgi:uncharacterized membrane protein